jgi:hypothetical protein|tara:strand:+ start:96 stop:251 length:156 start_codon:yes stop_codon:yes gene_type:complete
MRETLLCKFFTFITITNYQLVLEPWQLLAALQVIGPGGPGVMAAEASKNKI